MSITETAEEICDFLHTLPEVKKSKLYGSVVNRTYDKYSDIDIEIDVSGLDNGIYCTKIPEFLSTKYNLIFADYAPSLSPDKYVVSTAIFADEPFMTVDICVTATPHRTTLSKTQISELNNKYDHTLKLFIINLKHCIRGNDCIRDIEKMYSRIFGDITNILNEYQMLENLFLWLQKNAEAKHLKLLKNLEKYL